MQVTGAAAFGREEQFACGGSVSRAMLLGPRAMDIGVFEHDRYAGTALERGSCRDDGGGRALPNPNVQEGRSRMDEERRVGAFDREPDGRHGADLEANELASRQVERSSPDGAVVADREHLDRCGRVVSRGHSQLDWCGGRGVTTRLARQEHQASAATP
jgi:hypothetical protein